MLYMGAQHTTGIGSKITAASNTKSVTANAKSNSRVSMHLVIRLNAEVHHAEKCPLHANIKVRVKPPIQREMIHASRM
jgi:hypothetical protein